MPPTFAAASGARVRIVAVARGDVNEQVVLVPAGSPVRSIADRPGFTAPTLAARQLATLDQLSKGRVAVRIITGGNDAELAQDGDHLTKDERYARTGEYLDVMRQEWTSPTPFDCRGKYYQVARGFGEERLHRKQRLAAIFRLFARYGFDQGLAGHVTARDPEHADSFWVNPLGRHFGQIRVRDLIRVDHTGAVVEGGRPVNRAAFAIHSAIHAARPDVVAAAHTHSTYGKAWSTLGRLLDPLTQDSCKFYRDHALFDDFSGVVLEQDEGGRIAAALGPHKAVILRNHGIPTVGDTVEAAA